MCGIHVGVCTRTHGAAVAGLVPAGFDSDLSFHGLFATRAYWQDARLLRSLSAKVSAGRLNGARLLWLAQCDEYDDTISVLLARIGQGADDVIVVDDLWSDLGSGSNCDELRIVHRKLASVCLVIACRRRDGSPALPTSLALCHFLRCILTSPLSPTPLCFLPWDRRRPLAGLQHPLWSLAAAYLPQLSTCDLTFGIAALHRGE